MKFTVDGNVFEGTPEEIKEMMTLLGAEFPESAKPKAEEKESETKPKTVKRKARVGERILITDASAVQLGTPYKNRDILTVTSIGALGFPICGAYSSVKDYEYEVIVENDEESTPKFKEGDRVKALADGECGYVKEGDFGTVVDILNDEDDPHFIEVKTADDYDYFRPQDLELIADETAKLEDGDYVVALPGAPYYITSSDMKLGKIVGNGKTADDDITVKVIAHDDAFRVGNEYSVESRYFRKATDEEIAKYTKKPREFKKGDIVRYIGGVDSVKGALAEVYSDTDGGQTRIKWASDLGVCTEHNSDIELVAPVESRLDLTKETDL